MALSTWHVDVLHNGDSCAHLATLLATKLNELEGLNREIVFVIRTLPDAIRHGDFFVISKTKV